MMSRRPSNQSVGPCIYCHQQDRKLKSHSCTPFLLNLSSSSSEFIFYKLVSTIVCCMTRFPYAVASQLQFSWTIGNLEAKPFPKSVGNGSSPSKSTAYYLIRSSPPPFSVSSGIRFFCLQKSRLC